MKKVNICIAGLGNVGSEVVKHLTDNKDYYLKKTNIEFNILAISAKNKSKKRVFDIDKFKWLDNPLDLIKINDCNILIELIGTEKSISYELVKKSLNNRINVITANKALLSKHGDELFEIADKNNTLLLFEAAVAGGIPIIKVLKQSIFLNKIYKISGILNGTTNFILSEMEKKNLDFSQILEDAQQKGYAESDPTNDIEGIDSAHKLSLLSAICFGTKVNFDNIRYKGISNIRIEDINYSNKLGYKIKLISKSEIVNNKISSLVEPILINKNSQLANINSVLNAIKVETDHLESLFLIGEGAGGKATSSSVISDIFELASDVKIPSLGYKNSELTNIEHIDYNDRNTSFYLRITVKDIPGVLAKITSNLNEEGISIETILQMPENKINKNEVSIIITTHETNSNLLNRSLIKIENLNFVVSKIAVITIDKTIN